MKSIKLSVLLPLAAALSLCAVSCGNNSRKNKELSQEEVNQQKTALADSVLAIVDEYAKQYQNYIEGSFQFDQFALSEKEKLVKPEYLLEPKIADLLLTKAQKVNGLAIYLTQEPVRRLYGMPVDEVRTVIVKLAAEIGYPIDKEYLESDSPMSEKVRKEYQSCKDRGELQYFWQFQRASVITTKYIISQNPDLFFNKINQEQWSAFHSRVMLSGKAAAELSKYDHSFDILLPTTDADEFDKFSSLEYVRSRNNSRSAQIQQQYYNLFK